MLSDQLTERRRLLAGAATRTVPNHARGPPRRLLEPVAPGSGNHVARGRSSPAGSVRYTRVRRTPRSAARSVYLRRYGGSSAMITPLTRARDPAVAACAADLDARDSSAQEPGSVATRWPCKGNPASHSAPAPRVRVKVDRGATRASLVPAGAGRHPETRASSRLRNCRQTRRVPFRVADAPLSRMTGSCPS